MGDIVTRLRGKYAGQLPICAEAAAEIERLRTELASQTQWAELLSGNKCWCIPEGFGVCLACAYRTTMRQNEEARRG